MSRQQATNSLGYGVQWLTKEGWKFWDDVVYDSLSAARKRQDTIKLVWKTSIETRVYEVLVDMENNDE